MTRIKCSAIKYPGGKIYTGLRHCDCFRGATKAKESRLAVRKIQGFLTNTGQFVDRAAAAKIAFKSGQIKKAAAKLHSEDLW